MTHKNNFLKKCLAFNIIAVSISSCLFAQGRKDLKKYNVKSITEIVTKNDQANEITYKDVVFKLDNNGNCIEEFQYRKDGTLKEKVVCKYNDSNDLIEEIRYDGNGKQLLKSVVTYNFDGDKLSELEFDGNNQLLKRTTINYNNKGFKSEKQVFDKSGKLLATRKYQYIY